MFVIDVAGGDDIPRKKGPGIMQADLLVINKVDLAPHVGVDMARMLEEAHQIRNGRPVIGTVCRRDRGLVEILDLLRREVLFR